METQLGKVLCVLCGDLLKDAQVMSCGHKCCLACARTQGVAMPAESTALGTNAEDNTAVYCGWCCAQTLVGQLMPDLGESDAAVDALREMARDVRCMAKGCNGAAAVLCVECRTAGGPFLFCEEHSVAHQTVLGHREERLGDSEDRVVSFDMLRCPVHEVPFKRVCVDCEVPVCAECVNSGKHVGHAVDAFGSSVETFCRVDKAKMEFCGHMESLGAGKRPRAFFDDMERDVCE